MGRSYSHRSTFFSAFQTLLNCSEVSYVVARTVKNPPAMQETQVWYLGWKDALEKEVATYSSVLASRNPWTGEPGGLHSMGSQRVGYHWATNTFTLFHSLCLHPWPKPGTQILLHDSTCHVFPHLYQNASANTGTRTCPGKVGAFGYNGGDALQAAAS